MKHSLVLLSIITMLAGCQSQSILANIDFAKTNYGHLNSGGYQAGTLLLWNAKDGTVSVVGTPGCPYPDAEQANPIDIETRYEFGLEASVELPAVAKGQLENEVRSRTSLLARGAKRFFCTKIFSTLSGAIEKDPSVIDEWSFREAVENPEMYYLFINDVTVGDSVELKIDSEIQASAGFKVRIGSMTFDVKLTGNGLERIHGEEVVLMFNVRVLRPYFIDNGKGGKNPAFKIANGIDLSSLPFILKRVGKSG